MKKLEVVLWISLLLLVAAHAFIDIPFGLILMIGMALSMVYFYLTTFIINEVPFTKIFLKSSYKDISSSRIIGSILSGISYSILTTGITFKALAWPGANFMVYAGFILTTVNLIIVLSKIRRSPNSSFYIALRKRGYLLVCLGLLFIIITLLPQDVQRSIFPRSGEHEELSV